MMLCVSDVGMSRPELSREETTKSLQGQRDMIEIESRYQCKRQDMKVEKSHQGRRQTREDQAR